MIGINNENSAGDMRADGKMNDIYTFGNALCTAAILTVTFRLLL